MLAVLCGHYHDSETLIDEMDDDGDGIADRKVYQMLADYQDDQKVAKDICAFYSLIQLQIKCM